MENKDTKETLETPPANEIRLIDVPITDENIALNVLVSFLNVAQKRGTFSIAESAKIFECIQKFIQQSSPAVQEEGKVPEETENTSTEETSTVDV
jgi:hypothetical protein